MRASSPPLVSLFLWAMLAAGSSPRASSLLLLPCSLRDMIAVFLLLLLFFFLGGGSFRQHHVVLILLLFAKVVVVVVALEREQNGFLSSLEDARGPFCSKEL